MVVEVWMRLVELDMDKMRYLKLLGVSIPMSSWLLYIALPLCQYNNGDGFSE